MNKKITLLLLAVSMPVIFFAQNNLEDLFGDEETTEYTYATFKESRIILGESIEQAATGNLVFDIQHQFGKVNSGIDEFFGLDQATTRLGFHYGIYDWLSVGIGRTGYEKTVDGSIKVILLQQSKGLRNMPVSLSYFGNVGINTLKWEHNAEYKFKYRLSYVNHLLIARKFNRALSLQLTPTYIHRNLVEKEADDNGVFSLGLGGRIKLSNRLSVNFEYFQLLSSQTAEDYNNVLSLSLDMETGGHIFQLYFSNGTGILANQFIPHTTGEWLNGDIHFGFNISRTFVIKKPKEFKE